MEWTALFLSFKLAAWTVLFVVPLGTLIGRWLAYHEFRSKALLEALVAVPLILPPTVLGFYFLLLFSTDTLAGDLVTYLLGDQIVFSFKGLVVASILFNLPFAVQPAQRAFEAIPENLRQAAWCSGLSHLETIRRIELPLAWPGIVTAMALTFAHTMGEFGVVLMVGGNIPGQTRTVSIAIYDQVQAFDYAGAGIMSALLVALSVGALVLVSLLGRRSHAHNR